MMKSVSIADAKNGLTELLREVESGAVVRITRRGNGVAMLITEREYERLCSAAATAADFAAWAQEWRQAQAADFEGIRPDELTRWQSL